MGAFGEGQIVRNGKISSSTSYNIPICADAIVDVSWVIRTCCDKSIAKTKCDRFKRLSEE